VTTVACCGRWVPIGAVKCSMLGSILSLTRHILVSRFCSFVSVCISLYAPNILIFIVEDPFLDSGFDFHCGRVLIVHLSGHLEMFCYNTILLLLLLLFCFQPNQVCDLILVLFY
jgi:hypothetical protein